MFAKLKLKIRKFINRFDIVASLNRIQDFDKRILTVLSNLERDKLLESIPHGRLEHYEYSAFSQHGEDGIICEIFNRIKTTNHIFVEFGAETGVENNTHLLLESGWKGLWIEGSEAKGMEIRKNFKKKIDDHRLFFENCFVNKDNIDGIIKKYYTGEIDLLSVDIDGNDFYVLEKIESINPRVIITEYNANFLPPYRMVIKYDSNFTWQMDDYYGASIQVLFDYFCHRGYTLVGCDLSGTNAFWVRNDLFSKEKFPYDTDITKLYHPARYYLEGPKGHPISSKWDSLE